MLEMQSLSPSKVSKTLRGGAEPSIHTPMAEVRVGPPLVRRRSIRSQPPPIPRNSPAQFLSEARWEEMDFDDSGNVTFQEFLYNIFRWVGLEDEDE